MLDFQVLKAERIHHLSRPRSILSVSNCFEKLVIVPYTVSITDADIIMADGKSLEHLGVTPDEMRVPTPADLAAKRDPVLAYAASLLGLVITPEKAGAFFPIEWRK
jgi:hypothetical protein